MLEIVAEVLFNELKMFEFNVAGGYPRAYNSTAKCNRLKQLRKISSHP